MDGAGAMGGQPNQMFFGRVSLVVMHTPIHAHHVESKQHDLLCAEVIGQPNRLIPGISSVMDNILQAAQPVTAFTLDKVRAVVAASMV